MVEHQDKYSTPHLVRLSNGCALWGVFSLKNIVMNLGVNIDGQRIIYNHVIGYKKQNSELLLINTHGGLELGGEEPGVYIEFKDEKRLDSFILHLDYALMIKDFKEVGLSEAK